MGTSDVVNMLTQPLVAHGADKASPLTQSTDMHPSSAFPDDDELSRLEEEEIKVLGGSSLLKSVLLMVQSVIGGGLLTFPHAFLACGLLNMLIVQLVMMVFFIGGLWVLAWCSERTGAASFQALMRDMIGRRAELASAMALVVLIFGASVVYLDIFVDQVHPWFESMGRGQLTIIVAAFFPLLVLGRTMSSLAVPSLFGCAALLYVCGVIILNFAWAWHDGTLRIQSGDPVNQPVLWQWDLRQWLGIFPVVCFSYQGHISAVPLYHELTKRSMTRWVAVISLGLGSCFILYNASGCLAYLTFLDSTQGDILKTFLAEDVAIPRIFVTIARAAVAVAVCVTSGVYTFCARSAILDELDRILAKRSRPPTAYLCWSPSLGLPLLQW
jgi:amino acid permease